MVAYLELQAEATRRAWLAALLDPIATSDFAACGNLLRAAGLPSGPDDARALTLGLHGAVPHLLTGAPDTLAAAGQDDLDVFTRAVLASVCPERSEDPGRESPRARRDARPDTSSEPKEEEA